MNWRARLDAVRGCNVEKRAGDPLTKLTKTPFVGFGSAPDSPFPEIPPAERLDDLRAQLLALAEDECIAAILVHRLGPDNVAACVGLPDDTLRTYLRALDRGIVMDRGIAPDGYTQAVHCDGCGPVWLWPGVPARVGACPWCFRRQAGRRIPRPLVTCGDCSH